MLYCVNPQGMVEMLGIAPDGSLSTNDSIQVPILWNILNQAAILGEDEDSGLHKDLELDNDGLPTRPPLPWVREDLSYPRYSLDMENFKSRKPMKPSTLEFGQYAPFFNYLHKDKKSGHDLLGCANTALAALLSFYKLPKEIICDNKVTKMDWEKLWQKNRDIYTKRKETGETTYWWTLLEKDLSLSDQVALMCMYIYYETGHIWSSGSGTAVENWRVKRFLKNHNFNPEIKDYSKETLLAYLQKYKSPVLAYGEGDDTYDSWHYWILDGYLENRFDLISVRKDYEGGPWVKDRVLRKDAVSRYYHCNWGWNDYKNAYFSVIY